MSNPRDWDEIAQQGFLESPPANPNSPDMHAYQRPAGRWPTFWPGLVVHLDSTGLFQMVRKALPYKPSVASASPGTDLPAANDSATVFDNTFLLGLRNFAWPTQERFDVASGAERGSGPPQALPRSKLALTPKPWTWGAIVTRWRTPPPTYPTFGSS